MLLYSSDRKDVNHVAAYGWIKKTELIKGPLVDVE